MCIFRPVDSLPLLFSLEQTALLSPKIHKNIRHQWCLFDWHSFALFTCMNCIPLSPKHNSPNFTHFTCTHCVSLSQDLQEHQTLIMLASVLDLPSFSWNPIFYCPIMQHQKSQSRSISLILHPFHLVNA